MELDLKGLEERVKKVEAEVVNLRETIRISRIDERVGIRFGVLKGKVKVSEDFDAPLPDEMLSEFEGQSRCGS